MTKLVIVESPTKARTIRNFLPDDYVVLDSRGHIRDLPNSASEIPARLKKEEWANLGINVKDGFAPLYVISPSSRETVRKLRQALGSAEELIIATDEDREGESIGWHIFDVLKPKVPTRRIVFHEITRSAIEQALQNPGSLNYDLINAQKARRILDRLVGYSLSPLLWKKIATKLSAGRVQSAAMRMLVERELARRAFVLGSYWDLVTRLHPVSDASDRAHFTARLLSVNGTRLATGRDFDRNTGQVPESAALLVLNAGQARSVAEQTKDMAWQVQSVTERRTTRRPAPPFTTSTLQIEANRKFGYSAGQTMRIAQQLYEQGHITYMRTDSVHLSKEALIAARQKASELFGSGELIPSPRVYKKASRNAQEAHEAIRPAGEQMLSARDKNLTDQAQRLYDLIWQRTLATQLKDAKLSSLTVDIEAIPDRTVPRAAHNGTALEPHVTRAVFRASGTVVLEAGFLQLYVEAPSGQDENGAENRPRFMSAPLPALAKGDALVLDEVKVEKHDTKPPARYTEAALVKSLVDNGIGRPSTYATIIETIQKRNYAFKHRQEIVPTFTALAVVRLLEQSFASLVDYEFTARMEDSLDRIAAGEVAWLRYVEDFYLGDMGLEVQVAEQETRIDPAVFRSLELMNFDYRVRIGRYGPYIERQSPGNGEEAERQIVSLPEDLAPADLTMTLADELFQRKMEKPRQLGMDAGGQHAIQLRKGPYGYYLQLSSEAESKAKPKRVSLPKELPVEELTLEQARFLLTLPRVLGAHPDDGGDVALHMGRYGPYVAHARKSARISAPQDTVFNVTLDRALTLLAAAKSGRRAQPRVLKEIGLHPAEQDPIQLLDGRYGPYIKYRNLNVSIPKDTDPMAMDLERAVALIENRRQNPPLRRRKRRRKA